jgi:orotidine-5'-phosphate decarboxylase
MASYKKRFFYSNKNINAITINPYCGYNSLKVFAEDKKAFSFIWTYSTDSTIHKWQKSSVEELFNSDILKSDSIGLVVPGNNLEYLYEIRKKFPDKLLLIPGIGAQNGNLRNILKLIGKENNLFVIGRSLYQSSNIKETLREINNEFKTL